MDPNQPNGTAFDVTRFNTVTNQQLANNIRTFHTLFNNLRRDSSQNVNVSALKRFQLAEKKYLQLRFEAFNVTNHVTFGAPKLTPTNTAFGQITSAANTPRRIQAGLRLVW